MLEKSKDLQELYEALSGLQSKEELRLFLLDLCTPSELEAMADRWKAARLLSQDLPYRQIYEQSGVSTATVTRVARCITSGAGGYQLMLNRLQDKNKKRKSGKK